MNGKLIEDLRLLEPPNPLSYAFGAGAALLFILVLWLLWSLLLRFLRSPHRSARTRLRSIRRRTLAELEQLGVPLEEGQGRDYAIQSSRVIRSYLERMFGMRASVLGTGEFLEEARRSPYLSEGERELLGDFLRRCDLLKFARGRAERQELEELHDAAVRFVAGRASAAREAAT